MLDKPALTFYDANSAGIYAIAGNSSFVRFDLFSDNRFNLVVGRLIVLNSFVTSSTKATPDSTKSLRIGRSFDASPCRCG